MMKKFSIALLALAAALAITPTALADSFNYTFTDGTIHATGTLTGSEVGNTGVYKVNDGTININFGNGVMTGVLDPNPNAPNPYQAPCGFCGNIDDLLYPSSNSPQKGNSPGNMLLDVDGLLFTVNGTYGYTNIWGGDNNGYGTNYSTSAGWDAYGGGRFEISPTPEPSSLLLLGTGLLGLAFVAFRKVKSTGGLVLHT
jgi:hypothetical protein